MPAHAPSHEGGLRESVGSTHAWAWTLEQGVPSSARCCPRSPPSRRYDLGTWLHPILSLNIYVLGLSRGPEPCPSLLLHQRRRRRPRWSDRNARGPGTQALSPPACLHETHPPVRFCTFILLITESYTAKAATEPHGPWPAARTPRGSAWTGGTQLSPHPHSRTRSRSWVQGRGPGGPRAMPPPPTRRGPRAREMSLATDPGADPRGDE